jgi:hypothetical protein
MKIKLDENLPHALVELLSTLGHEVDSVPVVLQLSLIENCVFDALINQDGSVCTRP